MSKTFDENGGQPRPVPNGEVFAADRLIQLIRERKEFGITKYGVALQPNNNRDTKQDLLEEVLDALMYATALIMEIDDADDVD